MKIKITYKNRECWVEKGDVFFKSGIFFDEDGNVLSLVMNTEQWIYRMLHLRWIPYVKTGKLGTGMEEVEKFPWEKQYL